MSSLFKSIYSKFSAGLLDQELTDRFATEIQNRQDINDNDVWSQISSLEDINYLDSRIAQNDLKAFFEEYSEIKPCVKRFFFVNFETEGKLFLNNLDALSDSFINDFQYHFFDTSKIEEYHRFPEGIYTDFDLGGLEIASIDFEQFQEEIEAKREEMRELISKLKVFLIGKTQLRFLRNLIATQFYYSHTGNSTCEIPIVYDLREYWDIVGSLKKYDSLTIDEKHNVMNYIFLTEYNNGNKKNNWPTQLLN